MHRSLEFGGTSVQMSVAGKPKQKVKFMLMSEISKKLSKMFMLKTVKISPNALLARNMSSAAIKRQADVVILGGGMVGSSLACAMAGSPYLAGKKICLLEGAPKKPYTMKPDYSNRV